MGRMWAIMLAMALSGCRAPTPSFNFLAPYGSATVPPPATGSVGTGSGYYAPPGPAVQAPGVQAPGVQAPGAPIPGAPAPGVQVPGIQAPGPVTAPSSPSPVYTPQSPAVLPPASYLGGARPAEAPVSEFSETRASYESVDAGRHGLASPSSAQLGASRMTALPHGDAADRASSLRLNGMRVNDATQAGEPREFIPPAGAIPMADSPMGRADQSPSFLRILNAQSASTAGTPTPAAGEPTAFNGTWRSR